MSDENGGAGNGIKILVVEDDAYISGMVCELLEKNGYESIPAYSGTEALLRFASHDFALVLLDLMLPGKSGREVLVEIRRQSGLPVIVLTAVTDKETTVGLLRLGADDYLDKPFDNAELLARIEARLRRGADVPVREGKHLAYKDVELDLEGFDAVVKEQRAGLSKKEFEVLKLLMSNPKKVFTKDNIYESVWEGEYLGDDNTINVHISKIRSKLSKLNPEGEYIQTVWGIGFKMCG